MLTCHLSHLTKLDQAFVFTAHKKNYKTTKKRHTNLLTVERNSKTTNRIFHLEQARFDANNANTAVRTCCSYPNISQSHSTSPIHFGSTTISFSLIHKTYSM